MWDKGFNYKMDMQCNQSPSRKMVNDGTNSLTNQSLGKAVEITNGERRNAAIRWAIGEANLEWFPESIVVAVEYGLEVNRHCRHGRVDLVQQTNVELKFAKKNASHANQQIDYNIILFVIVPFDCQATVVLRLVAVVKLIQAHKHLIHGSRWNQRDDAWCRKPRTGQQTFQSAFEPLMGIRCMQPVSQILLFGDLTSEARPPN